MSLSSCLNPRFSLLTNDEVKALWIQNRQSRAELMKMADEGEYYPEAIKINDEDSFVIENELCARNIDY